MKSDFCKGYYAQGRQNGRVGFVFENKFVAVLVLSVELKDCANFPGVLSVHSASK